MTWQHQSSGRKGTKPEWGLGWGKGLKETVLGVQWVGHILYVGWKEV